MCGYVQETVPVQKMLCCSGAYFEHEDGGNSFGTESKSCRRLTQETLINVALLCICHQQTKTGCLLGNLL